MKVFSAFAVERHGRLSDDSSVYAPVLLLSLMLPSSRAVLRKPSVLPVDGVYDQAESLAALPVRPR